MGESFDDLLNRLVEARDAPFRNEPDRKDETFDRLLDIVQTMLEKLRDIHG